MEPAIGSDLALGLLALAVAAYAMVAALLERWSVSSAFAFLVIGAIIGGIGLGSIANDPPGTDALGMLAELTLALVLFSSASTIRLRGLEVDAPVVGRLLAVGLPLTIGLGTVMALGLFPGISLGLALLMGTILAPTDADLGHQVISDRSVPARVRRILNIESGLNDGIAAPVVSVALAIAAVGDLGGERMVLEGLLELAAALLVGLAVGGVGRRLLALAEQRGLATSSSRQLAVLALALAAYFVAAGMGASGFIAAFTAGLAFGMGSSERVGPDITFTETQSVLLSIAVWLIFGLLVSEEFSNLADPAVILFALLALTLMRLLPVAVALAGTGFDRMTVAFIGWFGPRGLASVVFVLLALEVLEDAGVPSDPLGPVVVWTVVLSVVAHGFSARWLAAGYGRYAARIAAGRPEHLGEGEPRPRAWGVHGHHDGPD